MRYLDALAANPILLAPMAGVADAPFRAINKRFGAGLTCSEMISAKGLHYDQGRNRSHRLLRLAPEEIPAVVQLFGSDPQLMADQAAAVAELMGDTILAIDINMGCPVPKVVNKGDGSALMKTPDLAAEIVAAMRTTLDVCGRSDLVVTAKIRKGWSPQSLNAVQFAQNLQAAGAAAITVHGRTADQFYRGSSDRDSIAAVKAALTIPVIASGDAFSAEDCFSIMQQTGADAVMVARGAYGNPWIFQRAAAILAGESGPSLPPEPSLQQRLAMLREHAQMVVDWYDDPHLARMRKHAAWYVARRPAAAIFRQRLHSISTLEQLDQLIEDYLEQQG
ncbi:MAG: tRNA dihydrouridine synthase DusB [Coriobacteriia bacterium]|nr:tRNA dihydrouridine synthase DusB [Coriobacteriia bacterium]